MWDADRAEGILLNLPGHGDRPRARAASVDAFADALLPDCPPRFDMVGHSLGGMVAQVITAQRPERVRRLVLVETWPGQPGRVVHAAGATLSKMLASSLGPKGVGALSASYQPAESKEMVREAISAMDVDALEDAMTAATSFDGWANLPKISAPTLVLRGKKNPKTLWVCEKMAKGIAGALYTELPGGHQLPVDCPDAFYPCVEAFLNEAPHA